MQWSAAVVTCFRHQWGHKSKSMKASFRESHMSVTQYEIIAQSQIL